MLNQTYDEIVQKIVDSTSLPRQEIEDKIQKKVDSLQGMVSKDGAAHIIGNELKVKLVDFSPRKLKIEEIIPGMNAITLTAKVINISPVRDFQSKNRSGNEKKIRV